MASSAEKQKRYRQRLKEQNPQKYKEQLKIQADKYHNKRNEFLTENLNEKLPVKNQLQEKKTSFDYLVQMIKAGKVKKNASPRKTVAERQRIYRQKLRERNPQKYEELKKTVAERQRINRQQLKEQDPQKYEELKRSENERALKYYKRKKGTLTREQNEENNKIIQMQINQEELQNTETKKMASRKTTTERQKEFRRSTKEQNPQKYEEFKSKQAESALNHEREETLTGEQNEESSEMIQMQTNQEELQNRVIEEVTSVSEEAINAKILQMRLDKLKAAAAERAREYRRRMREENPEKYEEYKRKKCEKSRKDHKMRKENPEKYEEYRRKQCERSLKYSQMRRETWTEEQKTAWRLKLRQQELNRIKELNRIQELTKIQPKVLEKTENEEVENSADNFDDEDIDTYVLYHLENIDAQLNILNETHSNQLDIFSRIVAAQLKSLPLTHAFILKSKLEDVIFEYRTSLIQKGIIFPEIVNTAGNFQVVGPGKKVKVQNPDHTNNYVNVINIAPREIIEKATTRKNTVNASSSQNTGSNENISNPNIKVSSRNGLPYMYLENPIVNRRKKKEKKNTFSTIEVISLKDDKQDAQSVNLNSTEITPFIVKNREPKGSYSVNDVEEFLDRSDVKMEPFDSFEESDSNDFKESEDYDYEVKLELTEEIV